MKACLAALAVFAVVPACGSGNKQPEKPVVVTPPRPPPPETEADREVKRHAAAIAIVPEGSSCLPAALRDNGAPRLDLAAVDGEPVVCATDVDKSRLLGPVACWKLALKDGSLTYQPPAPLPGHDVDVKLDGRCARGFCLPQDAQLAGDGIGHMSWSSNGKVAVIAGDEVRLFDAASKDPLQDQPASFSIRGDKGAVGPVTGVDYVAGYILVEAGDAPANGVWVFKDDGTARGPITEIGATTPISTAKGSLLLLKEDRIAVAEQGFSTVTTYELANGQRTKLVRRVARPSCTTEELGAYWKDGQVSDKCRDAMAKAYEYLIGASAVEGKSSWLVVLRGPRLGELGVLDMRTLAEKKAIKMPWCDAAGSAAPAAAAP
jgi:hypothetical protein